MKKFYKRNKEIILSIMFITLMFQLLMPDVLISAERNDNGVILVNDNNTYENTEFYKDNLFGIAGGFHLVGLDTVDRIAHVHGNILANNFINGGDFGTRDLKEVSYLRNITGGGTISAGADEESVLVVGKETEVGTMDNGNAWSIKGEKVESPNKQKSPASLWQDNEADFIDFGEVEEQSKELTDKLAALENNATKIDKSDMNDQKIIVTEDPGYNVYNLQDGDFNFTNPIHIKGFNKEKAQTLIINVDMSKMSQDNFSIPNSVAEYTDGSKVSTGEVNEWSNANVVWNVYDSSESDNVYTGRVENEGAVTGSILAPGAIINLKHNLNGTVIGNKIVVTGETHRDDYVPPTPSEGTDTTEVSVSKVWEGTPLESVIIKLMNGDEEVRTIELNEDNKWKHTFTGLDKYDNVTDLSEIIYTIKEVDVPDNYASIVTGTISSGFIVTNTENIEDMATVDIDVEKVWEGTPLESVIIKLMNGDEEVRTIELNEDNKWKHTFTGLDKYDNVTDLSEIEYTVVESDVEGYTSAVTGSIVEGYTITNTLIRDLTEIKVEKKWIGGKEVKPTIEIKLLRDGIPYRESAFLADGNLNYTWDELYLSDLNGNAYKYSVIEVDIEGYTSEVSGSQEYGFIITNSESDKPITPKPHDPDTPMEKPGKIPSTGIPNNVNLYSSVVAVSIASLYTLKKRNKQSE